MIQFILALKAHWKALGVGLVILFIFWAGWHVRGLQEVTKREEEMQAQIVATKELQDYYNKQATDYENRILRFDQQSKNLNQQLKVVYADNAYKCAIPASGLRILSEAIR